MKILIFFVAALVAVNSEEFEKVTPFVVGGVESQWGQYPSSVIIDGPNEFCGATLIDRSHVITSAQCILNENYEIINPLWFKVIAGDIFFTPATSRRVERNVSRIFVHEGFNAFTGENDLAILRLGEPVPFPHNTIEIARRQTRIVRNGLTCQLVAFGRGQNVTTSQWRQRQVALSLPIMDRDLCGGINFPHANRIPDSMMCLQTAANAAPCLGSRGSGIYCNGIFTGVLTAGISCNQMPAAFQQVRAYNRWIGEQILRNDLEQEAGTIPFNTRGIPRRIRTL